MGFRTAPSKAHGGRHFRRAGAAARTVRAFGRRNTGPANRAPRQGPASAFVPAARLGGPPQNISGLPATVRRARRPARQAAGFQQAMEISPCTACEHSFPFLVILSITQNRAKAQPVFSSFAADGTEPSAGSPLFFLEHVPNLVDSRLLCVL